MMNQGGDGDQDDVSEINGDHGDEGNEGNEGGDQGIFDLDQYIADGVPPKFHHNSNYSFATEWNDRIGINRPSPSLHSSKFRVAVMRVGLVEFIGQDE